MVSRKVNIMPVTLDAPTQKRKRGLATARQILDAAAGLFAREGFDGVPMRKIAQSVGVRESSLYNHFKSKQDILETLYDEFIRLVPQTRPSETDWDAMLAIMSPEEVFKSILFHVGKSVGGTLANTALIISHEKYRCPRAAEMYTRYVVTEPAAYYERLIRRMIDRRMVPPCDARMIAQQYNYVSITLTKEYLMAQNGLGDVRTVVGYMVKTLRFFCGLMKLGVGEQDENSETDAAPVP